ncbi:MAG: hypothetical protein M5U22_05065 [Thermoleophilia bacterium]|nr:hypothetical protein [Thermoleophilia bacterium]
MPRLTDFLGGLEPFRLALEQGTRGSARVTAPSFAHPYLAAGFLTALPWAAAPSLVVAPTQESAEELRRELALYLTRPVFHLPARGVWYGPEAEVPPRVVGRRQQALEGLRRGSVLVVEATTLMEAAVPGRGGPSSCGSASGRSSSRCWSSWSTWATPGWTRWRRPASSQCAAG